MPNNYGIKISKEGYDAETIPTEANKKNFILLDQTEAHKLHYKGYPDGTYTHGLGKKPIFFIFTADDSSNPTYFYAKKIGYCDDDKVYGASGNDYLIVFNESI